MKEKIKSYVFSHRLYIRLINFLQRVKFHEGRISLYEVIGIFLRKLRDDEILERANAVAFSFTLAIFPAVIFLFTLIPYIEPVHYLDQKIMDFLQQYLPVNMYEVVASTIRDIISRPRGGLLSFGFLASAYLATNGMVSLMKAFNSCYQTVDTRGFIKLRLIAAILTLMLAFVFILAILLLIGGQIGIGFITEFGILTNDLILYLILGVRMLVMFIVFLLAISIIYYYAPAIHQKWKFFSIGSMISTILSLAITYGFSSYISNFGTYNKFYGSIGALIALMIWFFLLALIMLLGYELNASVHKAKLNS